MPKAAKKSSRKPPEPSKDHAEVAELLRNVMPDLKPVVTHLDKLIRKTIPGLEYAVRWKKAHYGPPVRGWSIETVPYDVSVNLVVLGGAESGRVPPRGEGSRYVKIRSLEEARA